MRQPANFSTSSIDQIGVEFRASKVELGETDLAVESGLGALSSVSNRQPTLSLTQLIETSGTAAGTIHHFAGNFAIRGSATASGQILSIATNQYLYSVLGTTYGGNGTTTFRLPDLGDRISVGSGQGPGLSPYQLGQEFGTTFNTLGTAQMPVKFGGISQPFGNVQQSAATNYYITVQGIYPSRNGITESGENPGAEHAGGAQSLLGAVWQFAGTVAPAGTLPCDGRLLSIAQHQALFSLLGTTYGGDGITTFALPDLRGRTIVHAGQGPGMANYTLGQVLGTETTTLTTGNLPAGMGEAGIGFSNSGPALVLNYIIALQGLFPPRDGKVEEFDSESSFDGEYEPYIGEVFAFAGNFAPRGYAFASGQILSIAQNTALFSLLGTTYGGNGQTTFALPDLRGRSIVGTGGSTESVLGAQLGAETVQLTTNNIPGLNYLGTTAGEKLYGAGSDDVIDGLDGNDTLYFHAGGNDTGYGGSGRDIFYYGAALTASDYNDGGADSDALVLQGNYNLTLGANSLIGFEYLSLQSGSVTTWGDTTNNFYDYVITTVDANVGAGQQLRVNGQSLRAGEDLTFNGSAETDGTFLIYGGFGVDNLTGGAGNDIFFFEAGRFGAGDRVVGNGGVDALVISGTSGPINIASGVMVGIEVISFNARFATDPTATPSYNVVLQDGNIASGANLTVNASSLSATQTFTFNAGAVTAGTMIIYGGAGTDTLTGGANADQLNGLGGADQLRGNGGADTFCYRELSDSTVSASDRILDFTSGVDRIDLSRLDAISGSEGDQAFTFIGSAAFSNVAGQLRATYDAATTTWTIQGDVDGDGVADIQILAVSTALNAGDFYL